MINDINIIIRNTALIIISLFIGILYFSITESFLILNTIGIIIKKWYLAGISILLILLIDKKKLFNIKNFNIVYYLLLFLSINIYLLLNNDEILLKIKFSLIYFLPALLCILLINSSYRIAKLCFVSIIILSILHAFIFYLYLFIDLPNDKILNGRIFEFSNYTYWRNPINETQIVRYSFPGMEHGMFMAKLYILLYCLLYLCLTHNLYMIIYMLLWIIMLLTASRSTFIGAILGFFQSLITIKQHRLKLLLLILIPIIFTLYPFKDYYLRQVAFLYTYEPVKSLVNSTFNINEIKYPALKDVSNDYHLRNNSFNIQNQTGDEKNRTFDNFNKIELNERPLGWHHVMFDHIGPMSGILIISIYLLIFLITVSKIKFSNPHRLLYKYLFIVTIPSIFIKMILNQGENEYYSWIALGILTNLSTKNEN